MKKSISRKKAMTLALVSAIALSTSCVWSPAAQAEEATDETKPYFFDEIVVTATRTPVSEFDANANIYVITSKDIERNHYTDLSQALREVPGVTVYNYSLAGYNGTNGLRIGGAEEIVVLIDGVKVNSAGSRFSATIFKDLDNIERIEVLKGSASTLYGSDAKGGVINIITKKVTGSRSVLQVEGGSYSTESYSFMNEGRQDDWSWRVSAQKDLVGDFKDGRSVWTPAASNSTTTSFKVTKEFGEKSDLTLTYDAYKANYKYRSLWETFLRSGKVDNYNSKLIYNTRFNNSASNQLAISTHLDNDVYQSGSVSSYATKVRTLRISDQFTQRFKDDAHVLTSGFEFTEDKVISFNDKKLTNRALYLQDEWNFTDRLKFTGGVRYDNNSGFGSHTTPSVNLGYKFNDKTNMYIGRSEYFIPPSPSHLYNERYGNPNIKPETGFTSEFGINHRIDDTFVTSAHVFKRNSSNRIGYAYPTYANVGGEKSDGWDVQLRKQFSPAVSTYVGYTHTNIGKTAQRATNVDGYIPKGVWNIGADYMAGKFDASLSGKGVLDRLGPQTQDVVGQFFPATTYWVWDVGLNYRASKSIKTFIKVNNIFDKFYAEHSNSRSNWATNDNPDPTNQWWSAPGRNIRIGMEYTF